MDDLDRDGRPDELVFEVSLKPHERKTVVIKTVRPGRRRHFPALVYADLIYKPDKQSRLYVQEMSTCEDTLYNWMHHHGMAFESELMGYRVYFDRKQTVDLYGKRVPRLELKESGWYPTDEQLARGFGDDILRVSGSVGLGSVKPWNGQKALHLTSVGRRTQRILSQGNVRTVCEIEVNDWQTEGKRVDMRVRYILYAHHRDCVVEIRASHDLDSLVTGVQKVNQGREGLLRQQGLVGCWGTDWPVNDTVKYAKETVGLGVACYDKDVVRNVEDRQNNLLLLRYKAGSVLRFYITCVSMKEQGNPIDSADKFFAYLRRWRQMVTADAY